MVITLAILVIMESPSKASTVQGYLGSGYKVVASVGHVRDLAKSTLSVDVDNGFEPHYINIRGKGDIIKDLKKKYKGATKTYLATDSDREGEAISWHLATVLGIPIEQTKRITFNEVTKDAVKAAIKNPRQIDMDLVNSQQARRILDRIVGYKLSPFLWSKVRNGLSAGRVQSVATRIIVDRENEIAEFVPVEYWNIIANHTGGDSVEFKSKFYGKDDKKIEIHCKEDADKILCDLEGGKFVVTSVKKALKKRNPLPPFTTSTMQQDSSRKLGFRTDKTMKVAQELYEGINIGAENGGSQGLITYMRTDSLRISKDAQSAALEYIARVYGEDHCPEVPRMYKTKSSAQDAHEAIRPSNMKFTPESIKKYLSSDQYKLYKLIWDRFVSSQMASAEFNTVNVGIDCNGYLFKTSGSTLKFSGFLVVYDDGGEQTSADSDIVTKLPELYEGELLETKLITPEQHFTDPPPRFNEASFVKYLEEKGIGRPSTFATIVSTIISRGYVKREGKTLVPTELGKTTTELMVENFPEIVDCGFTANMEDELDSIAEGDITMTDVLGKFYDKFKVDLERAESTVSGREYNMPSEETDIICEKCGAKMVVKTGRYGKFAACPNYPTCKNTKPLVENVKEKAKIATNESGEKLVCDKCGADMVVRSGKFGTFFACSRYPECKNTLKLPSEIGVPCPLCSGPIVSKNTRGRKLFYGCSRYPECNFSSWDKPTNEKCPTCGSMLYIKKGKQTIFCKNEGCLYSKEPDESEQKQK